MGERAEAPGCREKGSLPALLQAWVHWSYRHPARPVHALLGSEDKATFTVSRPATPAGAAGSRSPIALPPRCPGGGRELTWAPIHSRGERALAH